jgi:hypothetical protein
LRFGVVRNNSSASSPRVTQIYIVVNYSGLNATGLYLAINNGLANSHGGTDISAAINTANTELNNTATHIAGHRKYIIMLSDGQANQHSIAGDSTDPTLAALQEADKAKTNGGADGIDTEIYTIHFGGIANVTVNSATETSQAFLAQLASGSTPLAGHQNGSHSDITVAATDSNYLSQVNAENNDGDNFFIVPVSADPTAAMTAIFNKIGQQIISGTPPAYITTGTLNVITHVVNNNGHTKTAGNFLMTVSGANPTRQFAGKETPGTELTLNPGDYAVLENPDSDYTETVESQCGGTLGQGQEVTCVIVNDDAAPAAPPLPEPPPPPPSVGTVPATLVVVTQVNNDSGTAGKTASDFSFTIDNPAAGSHQGSETGVTLDNLLPQPFNVTDSSDPAYSVGQSGVCSGTIALGQTETCVIIYTANPPAPPPIDTPANIDINSWMEK